MRALPAAALSLFAVALAAPSVLDAQRLPVELGLHAGVASPAADYAAACGHVFPSLGLQARTRGAAYVTGSVAAYGAGGGSDIACGAWWPQEDGSQRVRTGGLTLDGAVRVGAGVGRRASAGRLELEAEASLGVVRGRPGYTRFDEAVPARWLPWAGATVSATLFRHFSVGGDIALTRLRFRDAMYPPPLPASPTSTPLPHTDFAIAAPRPLSTFPPSEVRNRARWAPVSELRVGIRL